MDTARAIRNLSRFIVALAGDDVASRQEYSAWAKKHPGLMEELFEYERKTGMPELRVLLRPFFHPQLPLVGLNYSPVAHNTLHAFPKGWTDPLRQCRGIVFERSGALVAKPFPKFFNYGEHPETMHLPAGKFDATEKHDGHLGITFHYRGDFHLTTRGDFTSRTSALGSLLLAKHARANSWHRLCPHNLTLLTEIIHPETMVFRDYSGRQDLILIGAYDIHSCNDLPHEVLQRLGRYLRLPVTERWEGKSVRELKELMRDREVQNREGYVVRFRRNGLRVKFKFETYIGQMVEAKLSYPYLMHRAISGNREKMMETLPEEIYPVAAQMWAEVQSVLEAPDTAPKERWRELYLLVPPDQRTPSYQALCRQLVKKRG